MLRLVFNGRFLVQAQTGVQRYALETLRAFDALLAERADLRNQIDPVLAVPKGATAPALTHIKVKELSFLSGHLWEQITLPWFVGSAFLVGFSYSGPLIKKRQLVTIHDATVATEPATFSRRYRWGHLGLIALLKHRVDLMMTVSEFSRREIAHHFNIRRPMIVGREGWEHAVLEGDEQATLKRHGLTSGQYLFAVGSLKPNKNFALLGRALQLLPNYPLPVAVAGSRDNRVFQAASPAASQVRLLGFVSDQELAHLYKHAAWFVFPSLYEGFGLPAIEAMGNGCPVLAANAASIPEVCADAALYFDPHDPASLADLLRRVVAEPALRSVLLARAKDRLARYTWRANAELLAELLLDHKTKSLKMPNQLPNQLGLKREPQTSKGLR